MSEIATKLNIVRTQMEAAFLKRNSTIQTPKPYLVAVSKLKPVSLIVDAYKSGQRHFGENYIQELEEKAKNEVILNECQEIKWHFIGHLQSNKIKKLLTVPNLYMVHTVDSQKLADGLNKGLISLGKQNCESLKVLVQVNTSGEEAKSGISVDKAVELMEYIHKNCANLKVQGLMTIGAEEPKRIDGVNADFLELYNLYKKSCEQLALPLSELDLSMGMSGDYEEAIEQGSTIVRIGSFIFGQR